MKTFIIGDIHGGSADLKALLKRLNPDPGADRLILLGDLFDRGPDSWGVFEAVRKLAQDFGDRFTLLLGNHEDYLLAEKMTLSQKLSWELVGRGATVRSFKQNGKKPQDAAEWIRENGSLFYRDEEIQCVHAAVTVEPIEKNDRATLLHDHGAVMRNTYQGRLTVVGHIALDIPTYFHGDGKTADLLPPGEWLPLPRKGIICIDTGCGKGGRLTGMVVEGGRFRLEYAN